MSEMEFLPKGKWKEWDYNGALKEGKVSRVGKFQNAQGLTLAFYSWEVPNPVGVVIFSHGHGVHATFELLNSKKPPGERERMSRSECTRSYPGNTPVALTLSKPRVRRGGWLE